MAVPSVNITIDGGTNFENTFTLRNPDGTPIDLTGYTGVSKIRKYPKDALNVQSFTVGITSSTGEVTLSMASTITSEIEQGRNYYDIVLTATDGTVSKVLEGTALVSPTVSV
jgi:hypothetical protein